MKEIILGLLVGIVVNRVLGYDVWMSSSAGLAALLLGILDYRD